MAALLVLAVLLVLVALVVLRRSPSTEPDFTTQRLDGVSVRLSQYRGKPVLLNFWATWCAPCQDEMPLIQGAADRYTGTGLTVLAVDYQQTDAAAMRAFLRRAGARFPAVYDPNGQIAAEYGVSIGLPVSIFIDRSGKVEVIQVGQMSGTVLEQHLRSIL
ncbi:MAG: TlpA family protein disulfide reductase [Chloroflexi bacterium]|nr:MAG: TlpA family protein disulfide reductase [Chloroflexota bacterium]